MGTIDLMKPAERREIFETIRRRGAVRPEDVGLLRRDVFAERTPDRPDIEAMFGIEEAIAPAGEAWATFFVETVTDHVVWGTRPTGILTEAHARWLLSRVDGARTPASFAVLVAVLDEAHRVPAWFSTAIRARAAAGWPGLSGGVPSGAEVARVAA